jgi:hypothetical protein
MRALLFRWLFSALFGEQNAINFYKEDKSSEQLEAYAKKTGGTVVAERGLFLFSWSVPLFISADGCS